MNNKIQPISKVKESKNERPNGICEGENEVADKAEENEEDVSVEYDDVYEQYVPRYQEYEKEERFYNKIVKFFKRHLLLCCLLLIILSGIVVALAVYLTSTEQPEPIEPVVEEVVLMLSFQSYTLSNAPMLIGLNGELFSISFKARLMN